MHPAVDREVMHQVSAVDHLEDKMCAVVDHEGVSANAGNASPQGSLN